jgi:hypothetical protein
MAAIAALSLCASMALAEANVSADVEYLNKLVVLNGVGYDGNVVKEKVRVGIDQGFYAEFRASHGVTGKDPYRNELDLGVGKITSWEDWVLDVGVEYQDLYPRGKFGLWDMIVGHIDIQKNLHLGDMVISPFLHAESWYAKASTDDGVISQAGVRATRTIGRWTISGSLSLVYDPGVFGGAAGYNGQIFAEVAYRLNDWSSISIVGQHYQNFIDDRRDFRENQNVGGITYTADIMGAANALRSCW